MGAVEELLPDLCGEVDLHSARGGLWQPRRGTAPSPFKNESAAGLHPLQLADTLQLPCFLESPQLLFVRSFIRPILAS